MAINKQGLTKETLEAFTELDCAVAFELPLREIRKRKKLLRLPLEEASVHLLKEIKFEADGIPAEKAARLYNCSLQDVLKARYRSLSYPKKNKPSIEELKPYFAAGIPYADISNYLNCSIRYIKQKALEVPEIVLPTVSKLSNVDVLDIKEALKEGETQSSLAKKYNVSQTSVSRLNPNKQKRAPYTKLTDEQWRTLIASIKDGTETVLSASIKWNISRCSIYNRSRKQNVYHP